MPRVQLTGGAYTAPSLIANAQESVNLFPERNPADYQPVVPVTHYVKPGLRLLAQPATPGLARGLYRATNGDLYAVVGTKVYYVTPGWAFTEIGTILPGRTFTSMADNAFDIVLVDGSPAGYSIDMASREFNQINDPNFFGADRARYLDTFLIFNRPKTNQFYWSDSNAITFNGLSVAAKTSYADPIQNIAVVHREIWLLGFLKSENWYDSGAADSVFQETPGAYVEHGCIAKYSVAETDIAVLWLGMDLDGQAVVFMGANYQAKRISTHAIEAEWQTYQNLSDAVAYTYQQAGHTFYVINFVSADKTWVYDLSTSLWHRRASSDQDGNLHRDRSILHAFAYGTNVTMDWQNGNLYALDPAVFTDNGMPIVCIRSFPTMMDDDGNKMQITRIQADIECGTMPNTPIDPFTGRPWSDEFDNNFGPYNESSPPYIFLRCSLDGGHSWGNRMKQRMGASGQYKTFPQWCRPCALTRRLVIELSWSQPMKTALNGGFIESIKSGS